MQRSVLLLALASAVALFAVPFLVGGGPNTDTAVAELLASGRIVFAGGAVWLSGLLTAMTPCVYPLIPITVSIFGARKAESRAKAVLLTSAYVVGMGVVFAILGAIAGLSGKAFGSQLSNPWVIGALAVFMLVLASSMFGAFELALPQPIQQRLNSVGGAGPLGAFLMGTVSALIAAPCTGPALLAILTFISNTRNVGLGASLMFVYAMGIGAPFFLIGVFAVRLPKGGVWMEWIKSVFGVALVAMALGYIRDAIPAVKDFVADTGGEVGRLPGAVVAAAIVFAGVLAGAIHLSFKEGARQATLKALGVAVVVLAVMIRIGAMAAPPVGALWVRLGVVNPPATEPLKWALLFPPRAQVVPTVEPFELALANAKASGKPVMIDFFADWCAACKELDHEVYVDPEVVGEASRFVTIKVDATNDDDAIAQLFERYHVPGLPTVAFMDGDGEHLAEPRVTGFLEPGAFVKLMRRVKSGSPAPVCASDQDCPDGKKCLQIACASQPCAKHCG
jgi:thiol:disulfide interchange protein DsbD